MPNAKRREPVGAYVLLGVGQSSARGAGPGHLFRLKLNLTVCSYCTGVPVHTRRVFLLVWPLSCLSSSNWHVARCVLVYLCTLAASFSLA
jgi:hypothetical protein